MSVHQEEKKQKKNVSDFRLWKNKATPIVMLTAYDFAMAGIVGESGADIILVGDSGGMVSLGYPSTIPVTMQDMIFMTSSVSRANTNCLIVADMPYLSYEISIEDAIKNAGRLIKEGGADCVKLEGGIPRYETIKALVRAGIPVMGHVGLTPQTSTSLGGFKVQGKSLEAARDVVLDAEAVQEAGAFSIVLEAIPAALADLITQRLVIPTIGIGAGLNCDGQVLVLNDVLGMFQKFTPKFVRRYADLYETMVDACRRFGEDVRSHDFPAPENTYKMDNVVLQELKSLLANSKVTD